MGLSQEDKEKVAAYISHKGRSLHARQNVKLYRDKYDVNVTDRYKDKPYIALLQFRCDIEFLFRGARRDLDIFVPEEDMVELTDMYLSGDYTEIGRTMYSIEGTHAVGKFNCPSGKLVISDPCWKLGTWCAGELKVKKGEWAGFITIEPTEERASELMALHADTGKEALEWVKSDIYVGVEGSQAGIFDKDHYRNDAFGKIPAKGFPGFGEKGYAWFCTCCNATSSKLHGGIVKEGVVSISGYGDGGYNCYYAKQNGEIVAVKIVFIGDNEEEEE